MKKQMIIFSAGLWGMYAFLTYRDKYDVLCFVDNNELLYGSSVLGLPVKSPDEIMKYDDDLVIVVANQCHRKEILSQIASDYGIKHCLVFKGEVKRFEATLEHLDYSDNGESIVVFHSGLGNMLFQYAFYCYLKKSRRTVLVDDSYYNSKMVREIALGDGTVDPQKSKRFFESIVKQDLPICFYEMKEDLYYENKHCYNEYNLLRYERAYDTANAYISNDMIRLFFGNFQDYRFAEEVKDELMNNISFPLKESMELIRNKLKGASFTSVHVRRGDYINPKWSSVFNSSCDEEYYKKAIDRVFLNDKNTTLVFFSDDIEYTKRTYIYPDAIYIEPSMFQDYEDWFDMCLMSECRNNIIANSTFSWWAAWLNNYDDKMVIAPKVFFNDGGDNKNLCPPEWIRL